MKENFFSLIVNNNLYFLFLRFHPLKIRYLKKKTKKYMKINDEKGKTKSNYSFFRQIMITQIASQTNRGDSDIRSKECLPEIGMSRWRSCIFHSMTNREYLSPDNFDKNKSQFGNLFLNRICFLRQSKVSWYPVQGYGNYLWCAIVDCTILTKIFQIMSQGREGDRPPITFCVYRNEASAWRQNGEKRKKKNCWKTRSTDVVGW